MAEKITSNCNISDHSISIVKSPNTLFNLMHWADIAISSNGLTKYELAATGLPSVLLSNDKYHDEANEPPIKIHV